MTIATRAPASASLRIELPIPPSVNSAYRNVPGKGRVATGALNDWKRDAGWAIKLAKCGRVEGHYTLSILVPEDMPGDVSNRVKAAEDLLVAHGVTPDDRHARRVSVERSPDVPFGSCIAIVEAC